MQSKNIRTSFRSERANKHKHQQSENNELHAWSLRVDCWFLAPCG